MRYAILLIIIRTTRSDNNTFKPLMRPHRHRLVRLIRLKEKVQIAISQNSLRRQIFRIIRISEKPTARPSGRFNLSCTYVHRRLQIQNKEETGHIDTHSVWKVIHFCPELHIRCFLGAVQLSTCPIYLINTLWQCTIPCLHGKSSSIDAPYLRSLAQPRN